MLEIKNRQTVTVGMYICSICTPCPSSIVWFWPEQREAGGGGGGACSEVSDTSVPLARVGVQG